MALTIDEATYGYDINQMQAALNNINAGVVIDAVNKLNEGMDALREAVDNAWVGKSAETFKKNMETDKESVVKGLNDSYEALKSEMEQIMSVMEQTEADLIEERSGS